MYIHAECNTINRSGYMYIPSCLEVPSEFPRLGICYITVIALPQLIPRTEYPPLYTAEHKHTPFPLHNISLMISRVNIFTADYHSFCTQRLTMLTTTQKCCFTCFLISVNKDRLFPPMKTSEIVYLRQYLPITP